jgi:hypothetical protein
MAFVNLQRILDLNADKGEEMAQKNIAGPDADAQKALNAAQYSALWHSGGLDNGAELASRTATAQQKAQTYGGAGAAAAVSGGTGLDAALMGQSQAGKQYQAKSANLAKLMGDANAAYDARQRQTAANARFADMTAKPQGPQGETDKERRLRLQRAAEGYNPHGADEYAAYSDYIQSGRR